MEHKLHTFSLTAFNKLHLYLIDCKLIFAVRERYLIEQYADISPISFSRRGAACVRHLCVLVCLTRRQYIVVMCKSARSIYTVYKTFPLCTLRLRSSCLLSTCRAAFCSRRYKAIIADFSLVFFLGLFLTVIYVKKTFLISRQHGERHTARAVWIFKVALFFVFL